MSVDEASPNRDDIEGAKVFLIEGLAMVENMHNERSASLRKLVDDASKDLSTEVAQKIKRALPETLEANMALNFEGLMTISINSFGKSATEAAFQELKN